MPLHIRLEGWVSVECAALELPSAMEVTALKLTPAVQDHANLHGVQSDVMDYVLVARAEGSLTEIPQELDIRTHAN
jgi:hypothetical protein